MRNTNFLITKSHGAKEAFSRNKLIRSLQRSGLPKARCLGIADQVIKQIGEGSPTKDIFQKTLHLVKQNSQMAAVHYSLKRAIFELGPTGHLFEAFVARYFDKLGFHTKTCRLIKGRLVKHEVDVIAVKEGRKYYVECKFHNRVGIKNDIKIALYVKARWDDLKEGEDGANLDGFFLASNTAFSSDAITYAEGSGLKLLGVNAPSDKPFLDEIKTLRLYPVTSLRTINKKTKQLLLNQNILLASDIPLNINILLRIGLKDTVIEQLLQEIEILQGNKICK
jgi:hypothetical protein